MATNCKPRSCLESARPRSTASSRNTALAIPCATGSEGGRRFRTDINQRYFGQKICTSLKANTPPQPGWASSPLGRTTRSLTMSILMVTGIEGAYNCAEVVGNQLALEVVVAEGRKSALA